MSIEERKIHIARNTIKGIERKEKLIALAGGQCGYKKCLRSMNFHHRNPEEKMFNLSGVKGKNTSWEAVLKELDKCDLVCANCHGEIEEERFRKKFLQNKNLDVEQFNKIEKWSDILKIIGKYQRKRLEYIEIKCPSCNNIFKPHCLTQSFCCRRCAQQARKLKSVTN